jgi:hypothetical protein
MKLRVVVWQFPYHRAVVPIAYNHGVLSCFSSVRASSSHDEIGGLIPVRLPREACLHGLLLCQKQEREDRAYACSREGLRWGMRPRSDA